MRRFGVPSNLDAMEFRATLQPWQVRDSLPAQLINAAFPVPEIRTDDENLLQILTEFGNATLEEPVLAALTLMEFDALPGVRSMQWYEFLWYERTLLIALALIALCFYAGWIAPPLPRKVPRDGLSEASPCEV